MWDGEPESHAVTNCGTTGDRYVRGWWGYSDSPKREPIFRAGGMGPAAHRICFWLRWHSGQGRGRKPRQLGMRGGAEGIAYQQRGAWQLPGTGAEQRAEQRLTSRLAFSCLQRFLVR